MWIPLVLACVAAPTPPEGPAPASPAEGAPITAAPAPSARPPDTPDVTTSSSPAAPGGTDGRVYAIGDLHGDFDNAIAALAITGLVDATGRWTGGTATLVQTGDVVDRGDEGKRLYAWLRALSAEATAAGGRVVPLLGNHEVMNLRGDWRYVSPGDLAAYGGEEARKAAFSATGEDGKWLRTLDAVATVGDTVFVHGGVTPEWASPDVNGRIRAAIDAKEPDPAIGDTGPLWWRGYVTDPEATACPTLGTALAALGAKRMVVGHTTRRDGRVEARCGGALVVIDIGISDGYGAHLGVVELRPVPGAMGGPAATTDLWVDYPTGPEDLPDP
ncbi:MAG: metallophosphoesterase [Myxococcota bacterium]